MFNECSTGLQLGFNWCMQLMCYQCVTSVLPVCNYRATIVQPVCIHRATIVHPVCNQCATSVQFINHSSLPVSLPASLHRNNPHLGWASAPSQSPCHFAQSIHVPPRHLASLRHSVPVATFLGSSRYACGVQGLLTRLDDENKLTMLGWLAG